ncbi:PXMP2/4 family protein 4-like isoform X1 [Hylaeus volcanicus]|uniref:PXMP2/4 family protein 4-like isoform X1 n=1 Tax=Hylaeus volcanicus TaxID=313075 RepID=UPI0023B7E1A1|nr:PXMP2/4 family protein 4-like isoform X1 [Hylaeus volcanicus]XP_053995130.1 PXMP2/4 family protein 4-like isoform X1 [Hylaeus volcanicus]XP_053995131.1 PXMP2/4 family protein 4-like isoform X1 [Hylaeus volcanicus]XP_053995132.1 PXMP2/4 family protein 4-like isoform X1 [Hylaeus volcanicus]
MIVSRLLAKLKTSMQKRPLLFNSIIYGSFYTGAEFAQQTYNRVFKLPLPSLSPTTENAKNSNAIDTERSTFGWVKKFNETLGLLDEENRTQSGNYNWAQLKRYAIYGCFIAGPVLHGWYKWLDTFYKGKTMKVILIKLFTDQFILTPPLIVVFFLSMSVMEGKLDVFDECQVKFLQTFKTSCMYWLPVQFLNFLLIPPALRVSYVSVAAFCWVNILCYLKSAPLSKYDQNNQIK